MLPKSLRMRDGTFPLIKKLNMLISLSDNCENIVKCCKYTQKLNNPIIVENSIVTLVNEI
ncbi:hypothetical protein JL09_g6593 [Pichia kudriavzevii]|uniref:Uncharacterized protein n=1 Tax=Pichia kudriavzevii TaxID=4909 RepID=A0A099NN63_PICKU|nr:hypothetical protein JL09_g6594 [Pichia kudriavzevii]KGK34238.1 hypothetical protein JL09_g6593 [Pichia kudriavzevii]